MPLEPVSPPLSETKRSTTAPAANIYHVHPDDSDSCFGFTVVFIGYAQRCMTWPLYNRKTNDSKIFMQNVNPVLRTLSFQQNGQNVLHNTFDVRMLAWHCTPATTKADIEAFFKETLVPSMMNIEEITLYNDPVLDTDWYHKVQTWSDIIDDADMSFVLNSYASAAKMSTASFVKQKKARIYSFWTPGDLPISKMLEFQLSPDDMSVEDTKRYLKYEKEVQTQELDLSNDSDDSNEQKPVDLNDTIQDEATPVNDTIPDNSD
jgi:hypothetical protein